jgi:hypothetical protein
MFRHPWQSPRSFAALFLATFAAGSVLIPTQARAQEPAACLNPDPAFWPASARPYFMVVVDTSGSMNCCTTPAVDGCAQGANPVWECNSGASGYALNSCGMNPSRLNDAKCAMRKMVQAYAGEVNIGLATYAHNLVCGPAVGTCLSDCEANGLTGAICNPEDYQCSVTEYPGNTGGLQAGCGNFPSCTGTGNELSVPPNFTEGSWRNGAKVVVPLLQDPWWAAPPPPASNVPALLEWFDNSCNNGTELFASGATPIAGSLRTVAQYLRSGWNTNWSTTNYCGNTSPVFTNLTPLNALDRTCRDINVLLVTDGDESCDSQAAAVTAAQDLFQNGVTIGAKNWKVRVHVINFEGGNKANTDEIAAAGGTTASLSASNENTLSQALATIIAGSVKPETCDNLDNNCNGCTDEGHNHYCDRNQTCCSWSTDAQRTTCLNNYKATITPQNPKGDLALLPCTTSAQQTDPLKWLCYDPSEICDNIDNNCNGQVDEGFNKCGNPLHCPQPEVCDGEDNDCDGLIDEGGVCPSCTPTSEICDGCDNDCDGWTDNGVPSIPCGFSPPANCAGQMTCKAPQAVTPGGCAPGGGWNACSFTVQAEVCDGLDNNCDGIVDNNVPSADCVPPGTPPELVYGGNSQCKMGKTQCINGVISCSGFVGPSTELCDGIDNDCDGTVDESAVGVGVSCGINQGICKPGQTACVNGVIVCSGGVQPQTEICDNLDNNCNGQVDEAPLADAPGPGLSGCWTGAGNCCSFGSMQWCPPAGATCHDVGTLTAPCSKGALTCSAGNWACLGAKGPSPETCNNIDDNCDGTKDNGIAQVGQACGSDVEQCTAGSWKCTNGIMACDGAVGASPEQCNGLDDDCDGAVDEDVQGLGMPCGNATPPCTAGMTACTNGQIVCQGGTQPTQEICNNIDDNCDGMVDNAPLADAPGPGLSGCWTLPGNCCSFGPLSWCPPAGGNCNSTGTLTVPCQTGTLVCSTGNWACTNPVNPSPEICDGLDNNCDGAADNVAVIDCVPDNTPGNLVYGGTSQCKKGTKGCGICAGFVGPTPEICDGIDNDCDGVVDESAAGTGTQCGISIPPCSLGTTACVNGVLVCSGGVQPQPELCDGIDNNCNGSIDEAPLADAPQPGQNGCWMLPGNCCQFKGLSWCPPPGANCQDNGTLPAPCNKGFLMCGGSTGWMCVNAKQPSPEVCDAVDNDCNGTVDDGTFGGETCGSDVGECTPGSMQCVLGVLSCVGAVTPKDEVCDGLDNNCNGEIDDGIPTGAPCTAAYDTTLYPGQRTKGACEPGVTVCDGQGGFKCEGGKGPTPEICDGIDNDCDGTTDESGPAPDGINGTASQSDPNLKIGDACGINEGTCQEGAYGCVNGIFQCLNDIGPAPEQCDCSDNDCNGEIDNENGDAGPPLCSGDKKCVKNASLCLCAAPCGGGEIKCPGGQICKEVTSSLTGEVLGMFCVPIQDPCGNSCHTQTVKEGTKVICAPEGTDKAGCVETPVCQCKGLNACNEPCFGVTCPTGKVCAQFGPNAGMCVQDTCYQLGCQGCDKACDKGACIDSPCKTTTCKAGEMCRASADFKTSECVPSCGGVTCYAGTTCIDGVCVEACSPVCTGGTVCDVANKKCVPNKCTAEAGTSPCADGSCCDPITGKCGNCPCEGVMCPAGEKCADGQCIGGGTGGAGGGGGAAGSAGGKADAGPSTDGGGQGGGGGTAAGAAGAPAEERGVVGLVTGGGGCMCRTAGIPSNSAGRFALGIAALLGIFLARRARRNGRAS